MMENLDAKIMTKNIVDIAIGHVGIRTRRGTSLKV